jgi:tetratricopeptide (TPR) repeat protein
MYVLTLIEHALAPTARTLLRRLGSLNVSEISVWLSAPLLDNSLDNAEECLEELLDAQLIESARPDFGGRSRYRFHDLIRLFACERAVDEEVPAAAEAAAARAVGACLFLAEAAYKAVNGGDYLTIHGTSPRWPVDGSTVAAVSADPLRWFEVERPTVVAMIRFSGADGSSEACWDLASTTSAMFPLCGHHDEWQQMLGFALGVAQEAGDTLGTGAMLYRMGILRSDRQELDQAEEHFYKAAEVFNSINEFHGVAVVTAYLSMVDRFRGRSEASLRRYGIALAGLSASNDLGGEAFCLRGMAQSHMDLGDYSTAEYYLSRSLTVYHKMSGSPAGRAQALFWRGMLRLKEGQAEQARILFLEVLEMTRLSSDAYGQAQALRGIGLCYHLEGDPTTAKEMLTRALRLVSQPRPTLVEVHLRKTLAEVSGD